MIEKLKRSELQRLMHGVHLLMESTLSNDDVQLREAIFGRGINESVLLAAKTGTELMNLSQKWCLHASRVTDILFKRTDDVELGVHMDRRTFMVGGGGSMRGGGAGGGLAARERKDFSPSRQPPWPGLLEQEDDMRELHSLSTAVYLTPRSRAREVSELSLEGQEIPVYNLDGNTYGMTGFDSKNGPYIVVGGRLVPRGGVEKLPQHGYIAPSSERGSPSRGQSPSCDTDLAVEARSWRPGVLECPGHAPIQSGSLHRSTSPLNREASSQEDDTHNFRGSKQMSPSRPASGKVTSFSQTGTTAASTGDLLSFHRSDMGLGSLAENSLGSLSHGPEEEDDFELDDAAARVIARLRPARGNAVTMNVVQPTFDIEEPQEEPAPSFQAGASLQRPQSGCMPRGLKGYDRRDREVERARRQMCDTSAGTSGPMPTWIIDQVAEDRRPRTAGGRHTKAPQALKRVPVQEDCAGPPCRMHCWRTAPPLAYPMVCWARNLSWCGLVLPLAHEVLPWA